MRSERILGVLGMSFKNTDIGLIPSEWDFDTIGDSLYIKGRIGWKGLKKSEYIDRSDYRIINGSNVVNNNIDWFGCGYISEERYEESSEIMLKPNDIVMTKDGTIGKLAIIRSLEQKTTVASGLFVIRVEDNSIDVDYLYYYFSSFYFKELVKSRIEGSVIPHLYQKDLVALKLPLPDLSEQKAISKVLRTLDDKIDVNNQINKTLENMAQAIFKQWFVDFEFPNEEGEPYKSSGGEMVESELGMIPKGWEVRRIGDECFCSLGGTPSRQKSDYWNGDIPWVNSGEVNNFRIYKPSEYITKLGLEKSATKLLKKKTTVLAITGATLGQVSLLEIDTCTNQSVVGISENDKVSHVYIYPYVKSVIKKIIGNQTGGAQQHINKGNVEDTKLLIPNNKVLNAYTKLVRPQYDLISSICFENELLTRLRDSLIPKLMSGEIRVPLDEDGDAS
jgi:type I restriction enzyme S subunit